MIRQLLSSALLLVGPFIQFSFAQLNPSQKESLDRTTEKGVNYLTTHGQDAAGLFSEKAGPGVTALVLTGMLRNRTPVDNPSVAKGLKALEGFVKPDGGIYGNGRLKNYETCVSILCFSEANRSANGKYTRILDNAKKFLLTMQYGESSDESPENLEYGGAGYAGKGRPDLSNTAFLLEALHSLDVEGSDPAIQRALIFVSRCQNLKSPHNALELAAKVNDGGFFYTIPTEQALESGDRNAPNGGLRSYGSMTYSGLKSMIYAGLTPEDVRVKAALDWIGKHYKLTENPGMGNAGLFYYFHTFGAALDASGANTIQDADGGNHDWRQDLIDRLSASQLPDGSWQNDNQQWFENDKNLATAFALMALGHCR